VAKWFALALAMILALSAAALPLAGAGGAILFGLAAVVLSMASRRSMLESAVTSLFLAVAGLLVCINLAVSSDKSKAAAEATAKAAANGR
jgi:hypothetical protein